MKFTMKMPNLSDLTEEAERYMWEKSKGKDPYIEPIGWLGRELMVKYNDGLLTTNPCIEVLHFCDNIGDGVFLNEDFPMCETCSTKLSEETYNFLKLVNL